MHGASKYLTFQRNHPLYVDPTFPRSTMPQLYWRYARTLILCRGGSSGGCGIPAAVEMVQRVLPDSSEMGLPPLWSTRPTGSEDPAHAEIGDIHLLSNLGAIVVCQQLCECLQSLCCIRFRWFCCCSIRQGALRTFAHRPFCYQMRVQFLQICRYAKVAWSIMSWSIVCRSVLIFPFTQGLRVNHDDVLVATSCNNL